MNLIQFKILLLTFKSLNGLAPVYVDEMIHRYVPNRKLRSSSAFLLKQNKWNLKSYGFRTFTVAALFLWSSLPLEVKSSPSLNIFKSKLKTHLFKCAFNLTELDNLIFCFYISKSYCNTIDVKRLERMRISAI